VNETRIWFETLGILADQSPMCYWRMSNGAVFWWSLISRSQLLADRFAIEPFRFSEIESITVFREVRFGDERMGCDWIGLRADLDRVTGLQMIEFINLVLPPATPPNQAIQLVAFVE
jgi:hypothetical protein